ncbi:MAG: hypothetical protein HKO59_10645, partial [Phycisphaerales bacterium]|nr:hypothetical protein [Phycisphaerales bacterium]
DGAIDAALAGAAVTLESGEAANVIARKNAALKSISSMDRERISRTAFARQRWGDRWYNRLGPLLVDAAFDEDFEIQMVRFASDAYFDLVRERPELRAVLAASREAVVIVNDRWAVLVSDRVGVEVFSDEQRKHLGLAVR